MSDPSSASRRIDLDAARAARAGKRGPAPVVVLGGQDFELPQELPGDVVTAFGMVARGDVAELATALKVLFGGKYDEIVKIGLSWDDEKLLLEETMAAYGFELPGSSASAGS